MVVSWTNFTSAGAIRDLSVISGAMRIVMANFGRGKFDRAPGADYSAAKFYPSAATGEIIGPLDISHNDRSDSPGYSRLAYVDQRSEQRAPLAQSGEYREHLIPKGRASFRFRRDISNGRRRFRARRGYTDSYFGGHDRHFSDPDLCFALALVESFADDGAGREGSDPG